MTAHAFLEDVSVALEVLELRPDYRVLGDGGRGPGTRTNRPGQRRAAGATETRVRTALGDRAPEDVAQVADWRAAYRAFGAKPQRTRPSVEALLRRLDCSLLVVL